MQFQEGSAFFARLFVRFPLLVRSFACSFGLPRRASLLRLASSRRRGEPRTSSTQPPVTLRGQCGTYDARRLLFRQAALRRRLQGQGSREYELRRSTARCNELYGDEVLHRRRRTCPQNGNTALDLAKQYGGRSHRRTFPQCGRTALDFAKQ